MKETIIYSTITGHSKRIALKIKEALNIEIFNIKENPNLSNIETLYIISGIYGGKSSEELVKYVQDFKNKQFKKVVLITTACGKNEKQKEIRKILEEKEIFVSSDEYTCPGSFLIFGCHPNKKDINKLIEYLKEKK
ncbi:MAG: flavodoxin domain-containing protein [Bacilli bacterium]|nr:flavodoxin domain-containing protein [Bacilli bacterium]